MNKSFSNQLAKESANHWITFFTPTYQRGDKLHRVYESLLQLEIPVDENGTKISFEWLVVDDGSTDGTCEKVRQWAEEERIPVRYFYQENQGKHVAYNLAVDQARTFAFICIDSDDAFLPNVLQIFYEEWKKVPNPDEIKGLTARCCDPETKQIVGTKLPLPTPLVVSTLDLHFKYKIEGDMCGFNRTEVLRKYPFPTPDARMRFCPEAIVWYEMGKKYKEWIVEIPVKAVYHDTTNAITGRSHNRSIANYYLWQYEINNVLPYLFYNPKEVIKAFVGITMDGLNTGRSLSTILGEAKSIRSKLMVALCMPIGWMLHFRK